MASHGIKDRVAIVGMGCTPFGEHWDKGTDDLLVESSNAAFASAGVTKHDIDAYWLGTAMSGMSGMALARPLQLEQARHPRRELLRDRLRGAAQRRLRGGERRLRHRHGHRRREGEGLRLPGPRRRGQDAHRRHRPHADGRRHVRHVRPGLRQEVRRDGGADARGARPHLVEEPLQRRPQPPCAVPEGSEHGDDLHRPLDGGRVAGVRLLRRGRRLGGGDRRAGRGRAPLHRQAALHQGPVVRRRQLLGQRRPRLRLHALPRDPARRRSTPTSRPA